jgi:hypothetical protein
LKEEAPYPLNSEELQQHIFELSHSKVWQTVYGGNGLFIFKKLEEKR